jgi:Rha family phage regulatory protein
MIQLTSGDQTQKMTSREIAELTGKRHDNVIRNIVTLKEQIGNQLEFKLVDYKDSKGETRPMYLLTKKETLLLMSGYNPTLRLKIINRWEELEKKLPSNYKEALLALYESEEQKEKLLLQNENLNTVLDNLLDWVSILKVAKFNNVNEKYFNWRLLKSKSEELGYSIKKAESTRYDYQNLYHLTVFKACYPELNFNIK